jgi:sodium-independent sulfate anion transporter 11
MSARVKTGHLVAKALGIKLDYRDELPENLTRGESVFSVQTANSFVEEQPTSAEWVAEVLPSRHDLAVYFRSLFPFTHWIGRYNLQWLYGDLVAGEYS